MITSIQWYQISRFFEKNAPATQEECNLEAINITGTKSVHPTSLQGGGSYTVLTSDESRVVQFRSPGSALDMAFLGYIKRIYGRFVPHHESVGKLGELHVYTMHNVGGVSMYLALDALDQNCSLRRATVQDLAKFFASAWNNTPAEMPCPSRSSPFEKYSDELSQLQAGLPERFRPTVTHLISVLPSLLEDTWPLVPNHIDLLQNNIHVSKETGHITGICDWRDAVISPFGMSFVGLETMLGIDTAEYRWRYHSNHQELRDLFWETLY
ncbi:hypothetical protein SISSUDRAFT_1114570 [Sistotremastrum suecicum HHB10207 ss-3]|uniref:Aminoglycoside phosphotransferase domain-containing protein n=1 Tax=Sistotremastrum suecicum HHB10207 ss-3 TaxID=1314776 RepID=A0A166BN53_9AGAM|nr:hypothetical protein SISSUDRAFT_1114570 [Sistotremastrum suecicum HHB10207 ss-3]